MKIYELMTSKVVTVQARQSLKDAIEIMQSNNLRRLPVMEGEKVVGMIVQHDIEKSLRTPGIIPETPIEWVMTKDNIHSVRPDDNVIEVAQLMKTYKIRAVPVIQDGNLVGIITDTDLISLLINILTENPRG